MEDKDSYYKAEDMSYRARIAVNLKNVDRVELYYGISPKSWIDKIKEFFVTKVLKRKFNKEQGKQ